MSDSVMVKVLRPHVSPDGVQRRVGVTYERERGEANELRGNGIVEISEGATLQLSGKAEGAPQNKVEPILSNKSAPAPAARSASDKK
jgi:hypothetical protein